MDNLTNFRMKIDAVDNQIIELLRRRVEIVKHVGEIKKEMSATQSFIRAGREATMLRQLIKKADGVFPAQAIATMWRMIISSSLSIEQDMSIYSYVGENKDCFWLAREYFGTFLDIKTIDNADELITKISNTPSAVGVLPFIDNSAKPWWVRPDNESNNIYVFARIPFIEDASPLVPPALAIANTYPEPTEEDVSLFSITANISLGSLKEIFSKYSLSINVLSTNGDNNFLVEVDRFIEVGEDIIEDIKDSFCKGSVVRLMGSYAVPVKL